MKENFDLCNRLALKVLKVSYPQTISSKSIWNLCTVPSKLYDSSEHRTLRKTQF